VLISPVVLEYLHHHNPEFAGRLAAEKRVLHASRTDLTCYSVSWNTSVTTGFSPIPYALRKSESCCSCR
jgi:hypothetical protein